MMGLHGKVVVRGRFWACFCAGLAAVVMVLASAQAARAQGAPGSLTQLAPPDNCWAQTGQTAPCTSQENGLSSTQDVAISPDGRNVYEVAQADNAIAEFTRNPQTGALTPVTDNNCIADRTTSTTCANPSAIGLRSPAGIAISPDGNDLYVTATDSHGIGTVAEFARNPEDGHLTQLSPNSCIAENTGQTDGVHSDCANQSGHGIRDPFALDISRDGQNVYVTDRAGAIAVFTRNSNGSLNQLNGASDCIGTPVDGPNDCATTGSALSHVTGVVVIPGGNNVYTTGYNSSTEGGDIAEFARSGDGSLTEIGCLEQQGEDPNCGTGLAGVSGIAGLDISPDGRNVYTASEQFGGPIAEFTRNGDGTLTQMPAPNNCIQEHGDEFPCGTDGNGIPTGWELKVSPDGANVYAAAPEFGCNNCAYVAEFARNADGSLTQLPSPDNCIQDVSVDATDCVNNTGTGLGGPGLAVSPDDKSVYIAGQNGIAEFSRTPIQYTLTVAPAGSGSGTVTDDQGEISCPPNCQHPYNEGTQVTLNAKPAPGSTFAGWSGGGCFGTGPCVVTMDANTNVTATFVPLYTLSVSENGSGRGTVTDDRGGISCPPTCSHSYPQGTRVTLTASPANGSAFTGWSGGGCSGDGTCTVTMNSNANVTATFDALPPPGPGSPSLKSNKPVVHGGNGAGFSGTVNPESSQTFVFWQYGLDKRYTKAGGRGADYTNATRRQRVGSDASNHSVATSVGGLLPNALYHVRMVAFNGNGTAYGPDLTFLTLGGRPPGPPGLGKSFDIAPVSGIVFIVIGHRLIPLTADTKVPAGSIIDTLRGSLKLKSASGKKGKLFQGVFGGAVFRLTQISAGPDKGLTTLTLVEGTFKGAHTYASCNAKAARDGSPSAHVALSSRILQTLRSRSSGRFRTRGRYAAGTVRGTKWTTSDRCDGTLLAVQLHSVVVFDFVKQFFLLLPQGHSYLAGPHSPPPPENEELTEPHHEGGEATGP